MKRVCVVTGTRAEYGLLRPLIKKIKYDKELELQLIVTGMHLSSEFGLTYKEILNDGFNYEKIEMLMSSDTEIGISKSMGLAMISFSEAFERLRPDMVIILGDRYEMFSVASAAMIARIPICHLNGGEATEGLLDESIRHSITKMSYIHCTSTEIYRNRVIQLGENPERVFNVGSIGIESIKNLQLLSKKELEDNLKFKLDKKYILLTFHPVTLENGTMKFEFKQILDALDEMKEFKVVFTKANSDTGGRIINEMIDEYVKEHSESTIGVTSLGQLRYLSAMKHCNFVIGNSSSGILEAPSFKVPTINIGDRQKGRVQAKSVINAKNEKDAIVKAILTADSEEFRNKLRYVKNPYDNGMTSEKVLEIIKNTLKDFSIEKLKKKFYDIEVR